jgi:hypothetical protein
MMTSGSSRKLNMPQAFVLSHLRKRKMKGKKAAAKMKVKEAAAVMKAV